jgi:signal transduction histidine kinase
MDDFRVLLLAPTRRDREATLELLFRAKIKTTPCENADAVARQVDQSAGAILMTDDVFGDPHIDHLTAAIAQQPSWSDIPIILLFHSDPMRESTERVLDALRNVTLLDRPASSRTLVSSVRTALRARARQYQLRDQIHALRATESALREADHRKDLFLATLAHELRNPLAPIRTAAQVLASPTLAPQKIQWAQSVIQRQVRHMALLLDDLLDIARITRGKLELKKTHVALTEVVDAAVEAARPLIDDKKHHLTVRLPAEELVLNADPLRLSQILSNLLTNAAKYTDPAGDIEVAASLQGDSLLLAVKDNGIGIASNALKGIFDMFSQIDGASSRSDGGLGIGLSLVKGLVALHGGSIEAHSDGPGRGSEFAIRLPVAPHRASEQPADHVRVPAVAAGRRIMIVDDNKDAGDALAMLLELSNHEVQVAYSGRGALTLAHSFRPEVAFIDIGMPDLNGYEVAQALRLEPWGAQIRLVALTGWGQHDDRQRAKAAGFDLHITKPVDSGAIEPLLQ